MFKPYVSSQTRMPEFTLVPTLVGIFLGVLFGASSLYLALKVGMTVSASIPVAVLSITLFKKLSQLFKVRRATLLENNIVQTTGSAGESIAFGVAVTMPALLILGQEMTLSGVMVVAVLGSALGVLMMIPLRRVLIVKEHGRLPYPEGTACAELLIAGEKGGSEAQVVFGGFLTGLIYKFLNVAVGLWKEIPAKVFSGFKGASLAAEISPELLGVGFILGLRQAAIAFGGGILSSFVLIPAIRLFGDGLKEPLFPGKKLIAEMTTQEIWRNYILYIGAGAVLAGGLISLGKTLPLILSSARDALKNLKSAATNSSSEEGGRTSDDLPMALVGVGSLAIVIIISFVPSLQMNFLGALLVLFFGFLFVSVSSRIVGQIGSSSNPISGMTVATLLITSLIFLSLGWVDVTHRVAALSVAAVVCVAAAVAGATSQDLKTGFILGATPRYQQISILLGSVSSALIIGFTLNLLNQASTVYSKKNLPAARVENVSSLTVRESVQGPELALNPTLANQSFAVLQLPESPTSGPLAGVSAGKYLINEDGSFAFLVDPGINGHLAERDDGTPVQKYEAPKARLMSLIIDGILTQKLPWALVLLGIFISITLELLAINSLAFAVGVYLPISTTAPIFVGGLMRWVAEKVRARKNATSASNDETGPGVLFASGLIAGGAIAGIAIAFLSLKPQWMQAISLAQKLHDLHTNDLFAVVVFSALSAAVVWAGSKVTK